MDRAIALWPWQLSPVADGALVPVAVANPAVESVWVRGPHGPEPRSPQDVHEAGYVLGKGEDVEQSDPRLILPHDGSGQRLPSLSHLRRVRLGADGQLQSIGPVVLPSTTPYEIYGKEDPSVTWLDGAPWPRCSPTATSNETNRQRQSPVAPAAVPVGGAQRRDSVRHSPRCSRPSAGPPAQRPVPSAMAPGWAPNKVPPSRS